MSLELCANVINFTNQCCPYYSAKYHPCKYPELGDSCGETTIDKVGLWMSVLQRAVFIGPSFFLFLLCCKKVNIVILAPRYWPPDDFYVRERLSHSDKSLIVITVTCFVMIIAGLDVKGYYGIFSYAMANILDNVISYLQTSILFLVVRGWIYVLYGSQKTNKKAAVFDFLYNLAQVSLSVALIVLLTLTDAHNGKTKSFYNGLKNLVWCSILFTYTLFACYECYAIRKNLLLAGEAGITGHDLGGAIKIITRHLLIALFCVTCGSIHLLASGIRQINSKEEWFFSPPVCNTSDLFTDFMVWAHIVITVAIWYAIKAKTQPRDDGLDGLDDAMHDSDITVSRDLHPL